MPPRRRSKGLTGFLGVRMRPSGRFAVDISHGGIRWWLGTFDSPEEAARAYYAAAWRFGRPHRNLNFLDVESLQVAEFLAPPLMHSVDVGAQRERRPATRQQQLGALNDMHMAQLARNQPELVLAQFAFDTARKKNSGGTGPSNAAPPPTGLTSSSRTPTSWTATSGTPPMTARTATPATSASMIRSSV
uniref:Uncharacterized protein n=1 Tax=Avena sativa TaxID=4498 RepID=A0ACD5ZTT4_AVESA